jgi:hypothetical protein
VSGNLSAVVVPFVTHAIKKRKEEASEGKKLDPVGGTVIMMMTK